MKKLDTAVSAYGTSLRTPVLSAGAAFPASAWSTARERAVVTAGVSARRGGELRPHPGTTVFTGPPV